MVNDTEASLYRRRRRVALVVLLAVLCGASAGGWYYWRSLSPTLPEGVSQQEYDAAAEQFRRRYGDAPDRMDVLSWLGESAVQEGKFELAIACLREIPPEHPRYGCTSRHQQGLALLALNRAVEAEEQFREFLRLAESNPGIDIPPRMLADARDRLRFIYEVQLRFEERREVVETNVAAGFYDRFDLVKYCFPALLRWNGPQAVVWLENFYEEDPDDIAIRVALARYRTGQGKLQEAERILESCLTEQPENLRAIAALLENLREQGRWERMQTIAEGLPAPDVHHPWLLLRMRGHVANRNRDYQQAAECFRLVLKTDPANAESCQGLARALMGLGEQGRARKFLETARILGRIQNRTGKVQNAKDVQNALEVARLCEQIGLTEFAQRWAQWAVREAPNDPEPRRWLERLRGGRSSGSAKRMRDKG